MSNFFREFDLNPIGGSPVISASDPRAMFYFGFVSKGQEISVVTGGSTRVLASFAFANQATPFSSIVPSAPDAILEPLTGGPDDFKTVAKFDGHERSHVVMWLDTSGGQPPANSPMIVRVRAWG